MDGYSDEIGHLRQALREKTLEVSALRVELRTAYAQVRALTYIIESGHPDHWVNVRTLIEWTVDELATLSARVSEFLPDPVPKPVPDPPAPPGPLPVIRTMPFAASDGRGQGPQPEGWPQASP